jgi:histidinol-phosphate aminotransferase
MNPNLPPRPDFPLSYNSNEDGIFLHKGENPFPPHQQVLMAIQQAAEDCNRYPDTNAVELRDALANYLGEPFRKEHIILGNGSDELIDLSVVCFSEQNQTVLTFEPSFFVYGFCAKRHNRSHATIQRSLEFHLPPFKDIKKVIPKNTALTFIANPNNPTGTLANRKNLLEYIEKSPGKIVIDECYFEFCGESVVDLAMEHPNLIVLRSLSKSFGLAGLRIGYAVAHPETIDVMNRHAMTFPVNSMAQAAGIAVLKHVDRYQDHIERLIEERDKLRRTLMTAGFTVPESYANFILALDGGSVSVDELRQVFLDHRIYVSDQSKNVGRPALRIAAGTPEENFQLIHLIEKNFA